MRKECYLKENEGSPKISLPSKWQMYVIVFADGCKYRKSNRFRFSWGTQFSTVQKSILSINILQDKCTKTENVNIDISIECTCSNIILQWLGIDCGAV